MKEPEDTSMVEADQLSAPSLERASHISRRGFLGGVGGAVALGGALAALGGPGVAYAEELKSRAKYGPAVASGANNYYWITENIGDPFYKLGLAGMNAAAKLFGFKAQIEGPSNVSTAEMTTAFQEILAKPGTAGILSYFQSASTSGPLYARQPNS